MGSSALVVALAAGALLAALGALVAVLFRSGDARRLDTVLTEVAAARQASQSLDTRFADLRRAVDERVAGVEQSLTEGQKTVANQLVSSAKVLSEVGEKIGRVFEASQRIEKLAGDMTRLEDLLKPPKLRGLLGETFLEQALAQVLPPGTWTMQHKFRDGLVVDAAIRVGERIVPIDSKFPLENFRRARELEDETERKRARKAFAGDVRRHIEAIAEKYIRPDEGTFEFALMYIPAEAVYSEIVEEGEDAILPSALMERRVIPVSPRLLYAYLATVALGLRGLELQENARQIHGLLAELARGWEKVEAPFNKISGHLANAQKQYEDARTALLRFAARLSGVAEIGGERLEAEPEQQPSLQPPA
jgi:DNA recombination protein RmuC